MGIRINVGATFNARDLQRARRELDAIGRQAETTQGKMLRLGASMKSLGGGMSKVGKSLTRNITMPFLAAGLGSIKLATDFETSFAKIRGLVGVAAEDIDELREAALRLGPQFGRSANEAGEALFFITSAGLRGADAISTLEASLKASAAGLGDVATIADLVTSAVNAFGSANLSAGMATDILANAVRLGKLPADQLAGSIGQVLPLASAMGVSFDQVAATFAAMSRTGTNAAQASTQLRAIMSQILSVTPGAAKALAEVGLSGEGLRKQLREKGLLSTLQTLVTAFDGNAAATEAVFGSIRALTGVVDLLGSNADATTQIFDDMTRSLGVNDEAYNAVADTAGQKFAVALAELKSAGIAIGQTLLPVALDLVKAFQGIVQKFMDMEKPQREALIKFAGIAAIAGPVLMFFGSLITTLGMLVIVLAKVSIGMVIATGGLVLLGAAIAGVAWKNMTHDSSMAAEALRLEASAASVAAGGYTKLAEQTSAAAKGLRDHIKFAEGHKALGDFRKAESAQIAEQAKLTALLSDATVDLGDATEGLGNDSKNAGPKVVSLTKNMRGLLQELNETNVGTGDAGDSIAQFSRELLAAGKITDQTAAAASRLAQVVRRDIDKALAAGNKRLDEARQKFGAYRDAIAGGILRGNALSDAVSGQTDALQTLTRAEEEYEKAVASEDVDRIEEADRALQAARKSQTSFIAFLQTGLDTAQGFAAQIDSLRLAGASMDVVREIAELGAKTGGRVISELMAGGAEAIEQANALVAAVEAVAATAGNAAAQQFHGAGVRAAKSFVAAIEATIPELQSVLDRIADMIEKALGVRPDMDISGRTRFIDPGTPGAGGGAPALTPGMIAFMGGAENIAKMGQLKLSDFDNFSVPGLAKGGLVTSPTLAMIGEAGPEAVIPLGRGGMGGTINITVNGALDAEGTARTILRTLRDAERRTGERLAV